MSIDGSYKLDKNDFALQIFDILDLLTALDGLAIHIHPARAHRTDMSHSERFARWAEKADLERLSRSLGRQSLIENETPLPSLHIRDSVHSESTKYC